MKQLTFTFCLGVVLVLFSKCAKEVAAPSVAANNAIVGAWELRQAQSSMMPSVTYAPGNGTILKFSDSSYQMYTDANLVKSGRYHIVTDTTVEAEVGLVIPAGQFTQRIVFDTASAAPKTFMEVSGNKLTLLSGYFPLDGGSMLSYEKMASNP